MVLAASLRNAYCQDTGSAAIVSSEVRPASRPGRAAAVRSAAMVLADLSRVFRNAYLDHAQLTAQLRAWAEAFPALCRLTSIARPPEGRDVWLLAIGREPDRVRPAV